MIAGSLKNSGSGSSGGSSGGSGGSGGSSGSSGALTASGASGSYPIGSAKGKDFVNNAAAGSTMTGGDGSKWTKNADGSTTITKDGKSYRVGGSSGGSGSGKTLNGINKALNSVSSSGRSTLGSTLAGMFGSSGGTASRTGGTTGTTGAAGSAVRNTGSSIGYVSRGTHKDQTIRDMSPEDYERLMQIKQRYATAQANGDTAGMEKAHHDAEELRGEYGYSGGVDGSDYISNGGYYSGRVMSDQMTKTMNNAYADYQQKMEAAANAQQNAIQAGVDSAVAGLEGQKYDVDKQTELNNAAAEKAYMQSINPNGSVAENLAANGLLPTGATETSQISAGNTFQNALNSNATTRTEALAQIEQAITQARLNGDLEAAQALSNLLQTVAAKGYENAQNILAAQQWGQQFGLSQADQTGYYGGQPTMAMRQLQLQQKQVEQDLEAGRIDMETARKQLEYLQAQIDGMNAETAGQNLSNRYSQWQLDQLGY